MSDFGTSRFDGEMHNYTNADGSTSAYPVAQASRESLKNATPEQVREWQQSGALQRINEGHGPAYSGGWSNGKSHRSTGGTESANTRDGFRKIAEQRAQNADAVALLKKLAGGQ